MNSPYNGKFRVSNLFSPSRHDGIDLVGIDSKEIHSTVNGTVERAGWENPADQKQGFGIYVRIKKENSNDKYYFGHMSRVTVSAGESVKIGDIIGIEGSTGYSTGSHCHYCIRGNGSKAEIKDVSVISGIPNKLGIYDDGYKAQLDASKKSVTEIAREVISGLWGNGAERRAKLTAEGYDYSEVQSEVNRIVAGSKAPAKGNEEIAREVVAGLWGNGQERKDRLQAAGYNPTEIQKIVNSIL